jgi:hypothetical protein
MLAEWVPPLAEWVPILIPLHQQVVRLRPVEWVVVLSLILLRPLLQQVVPWMVVLLQPRRLPPLEMILLLRPRPVVLPWTVVLLQLLLLLLLLLLPQAVLLKTTRLLQSLPTGQLLHPLPVLRHPRVVARRNRIRSLSDFSLIHRSHLRKEKVSQQAQLNNKSSHEKIGNGIGHFGDGRSSSSRRHEHEDSSG